MSELLAFELNNLNLDEKESLKQKEKKKKDFYKLEEINVKVDKIRAKELTTELFDRLKDVWVKLSTKEKEIIIVKFGKLDNNLKLKFINFLKEWWLKKIFWNEINFKDILVVLDFISRYKDIYFLKNTPKSLLIEILNKSDQKSYLNLDTERKIFYKENLEFIAKKIQQQIEKIKKQSPQLYEEYNKIKQIFQVKYWISDEKEATILAFRYLYDNNDRFKQIIWEVNEDIKFWFQILSQKYDLIVSKLKTDRFLEKLSNAQIDAKKEVNKQIENFAGNIDSNNKDLEKINEQLKQIDILERKQLYSKVLDIIEKEWNDKLKSKISLLKTKIDNEEFFRNNEKVYQNILNQFLGMRTKEFLMLYRKEAISLYLT